MPLGYDSIQRIYQLSPSSSGDEEDASLSAFFGPFFKHKRGTGRAFPTKFTPPTDSITPTELFRPTVLNQWYIRYIHRNDPRAMLILTDGACLGNGQPNPRAGWAFVHGPGPTGQPLVVSGRLESEGPFGDESIQSSNRAELRAVIAALRFRFWPGEGFNSLTIATDSEYVVEGSTKWAKTWIQNDWKTAGGADVKNRDLWEMLLGEVEKLNAGLAIRFWKIPREWNEVADGAAKRAAEEDRVPAEWTTNLGVL
ncbi:ribonuclease H-like domain-containing protein [Hypomontagnella monticulosa]|nr:ribonuclease H-like domain-containing protein [Hypomontagnella monticulosa]